MSSPNYITPAGAARLQEELSHLCTVERPKTVDEVAERASHAEYERLDFYLNKKELSTA